MIGTFGFNGIMRRGCENRLNALMSMVLICASILAGTGTKPTSYGEAVVSNHATKVEAWSCGDSSLHVNCQHVLVRENPALLPIIVMSQLQFEIVHERSASLIFYPHPRPPRKFS